MAHPSDVFNRGYTRTSFLKPVVKSGAVIVTRLRKDAVLYSELKQTVKRKRGRPRKYGKRIKLQNVVKGSGNWFKVKAFLYGKEQVKDVKVFKALYKPAGCMVQVVVVREGRDCFRWLLFVGLCQRTNNLHTLFDTFSYMTAIGCFQDTLPLLLGQFCSKANFSIDS
jgi:hypothetical protein